MSFASGVTPAPPSVELVQKLIALEKEIRVETISVGMILEGEIRGEDKFTCRHAARAVVIFPVNEKGRLRRKVQEKVFLWSERWGWFTYFEAEVRDTKIIQIFSEIEGAVQVR